MASTTTALESPPALRRVAIYGVAGLAVLLWAGTPAATKLAVGQLDPLAVGVLRTVIAALLALPLVLINRPALPARRGGRISLLLSSLGGFALFPLLFSLGVSRTSAGHAALLIAVAPLFTGLIAAILVGRLPARRWWLGSVVALVGIVVLIDGRFGLSLSGGGLVGDLLVIASCFAAAVGYVAGARAAREISAWTVTLWNALGAAALLAPFALVLLPWSALWALGWSGWAALIYLAIPSSMLAYAMWYWALAQDDIGRTGTIQFAQPLLGMLIAVVLLNEALTRPLLAAAALIVAGVAVAQSKR